MTRQSILPGNKRKSEPFGFLCFTLDGREYGIDLNLVRQIVKPPPLTWVPRTEPFVLGIVSIRGAVVTLVDLRQLMDFDPTSWPITTRVLIVEMENEQVGLLVDSVTQVRRIEASKLETEPTLGDGPSAEQVLFVARPTPDELIIIIDLDAILGDSLA